MAGNPHRPLTALSAEEREHKSKILEEHVPEANESIAEYCEKSLVPDILRRHKSEWNRWSSFRRQRKDVGPEMNLLRTSIELLNIKNQWRCMQERDKKFMAEKEKSFILLSCWSLCPAESPISDISPRHSDLSANQEELQTGKTDPQEPPGLQRTRPPTEEKPVLQEAQKKRRCPAAYLFLSFKCGLYFC
ncbi:uncharacterized protein ACNLHF_013963 [Anomaloglossus baeobatrachus]